VLERLAAQEVERERLALAALDAAIAEQQRKVAQEIATLPREQEAAGGLADGAALYAKWLAGSRRRRQAAEREIERLAQARAEQMRRLIERRLERKRLELLRARARARHEAAARRREQHEADELATLRAARATRR
jgi:flagellar export protein FliJ